MSRTTEVDEKTRPGALQCQALYFKFLWLSWKSNMENLSITLNLKLIQPLRSVFVGGGGWSSFLYGIIMLTDKGMTQTSGQLQKLYKCFLKLSMGYEMTSSKF